MSENRIVSLIIQSASPLSRFSFTWQHLLHIIKQANENQYYRVGEKEKFDRSARGASKIFHRAEIQ